MVALVIIVALVVGVFLMSKGLCCKWCYNRVQAGEKYIKKEDGQKSAAADGAANQYKSMESAKGKGGKDGKQNVYVEDKGENRPSILNFDITADVTDLEASRTGVAETP